MEINQSKIIMNTVGGLGNQLFIFYAGQYIAEQLKVQVDYYFEPIIKPKHQSNSSLDSFSLEYRHYNSGVKKIWRKARAFIPDRIKLALLEKLSSKSSKNLTLSTSLLSIYREQFLPMNNELHEISLNLNVKSKLFISGFFQDFHYFDACSNKQVLELKNPSNWFRSISMEINEKQPIILHLRLTDYIRLGNEIGFLSQNYWRNLIDHVLLKYPNQEIWVFSDDFNSAKEFLMPLNSEVFKYIEKSENQDPAEVLLAMSLGKVLLLSNSTFSLWAGKVSNTKGEIFVPYPIFQNHKSRVVNLPTHWSKVDSIFATEKEINFIAKTLKSKNLS